MLALIAHGGGSVVALGALALVAGLYVAGTRAARRASGARPHDAWRAAAFALGLTALALAESPLLDVEERLGAHMLQHVLLVGAAAPLLALGLPIVRALVLVPPRLRRVLHGGRRRFERAVVSPLWAAVLAHAAALALWHLPPLYELALRNHAAHLAEHVSFLGTALVLWWTLLGAGGVVRASGQRLAALVAVGVQGALLGALLAFSGRPWYEPYVREGHDGLLDQQLAGLVMWAGGGLAPVVASFVLVAHWLERGGQPPERDRAHRPVRLRTFAQARRPARAAAAGERSPGSGGGGRGRPRLPP